MTQNICVLGGAGFIGSHLVEMLVSEGNNVTVLDDLSNSTLDNLSYVKHNIHFIKRDVSTPNYANRLGTFDVIYYLPCWPRSLSFSNPIRDIEVNLIGMVNTIRHAEKNDTKIIFSSNSGIYDTSKIPINEDTKDNPKTPYDLNKLTSEKYLRLYDIPHVIFRFATVYGPRQKTSDRWKPVIIEFIDKLSRGIPPTIFWDGKQTRAFIYVDDLVEALLNAKDNQKAVGETMILGSGAETSINQVYEAICNELDVKIEANHGPKAEGDIRRMCYDCGKAERILGWKAQTSLNDGIKRIIEIVRRKEG